MLSQAIDSGIERAPNWESIVGIDKVGGVNLPTAYGWLDLADAKQFYIQGPAYSNYLAACPRPIMPNTGKLSLLLEVMVDENATHVAEALEFDTRISIGGLNYNFSSQFNYATGFWQISNQEGGWTNTEFVFSEPDPWTWTSLRFDYSFNLATLKYSYLSMRAGNLNYYVPPSMGNLTPTKLGWTDTCNLQIQQDLAAEGGAFKLFTKNIGYVWS